MRPRLGPVCIASRRHFVILVFIFDPRALAAQIVEDLLLMRAFSNGAACDQRDDGYRDEKSLKTELHREHPPDAAQSTALRTRVRTSSQYDQSTHGKDVACQTTCEHLVLSE